MRNLPTVMLLAVAATLSAAAPVPVNDCTCPAARLDNGWCSPCAVGYVAAIEVRSAMLHEALDAHGHDINTASIRCPTCREALECDGYCETHRHGYVDDKLYFSKLTWLIARGERLDVASLSCATCRASATTRRADDKGPAWCETCKLGMVGNVAFKDKALFDAAVKEYQRLLAAVETARRCEYCGVARFMRAACPRCDIDYGEPREQRQ